MKLCPKCNYSNQDFDTVCNSCGSPLDSVNESGTYGMNTGGFGSPNFNGMNPPMPVKTNGMAIASMVLGIVSIPLDCCCYIGVIPAILAIIFGILSRKAIRESSGNQKGDGMALVGLILGSVALVIAIGLIIYAVAVGGITSNQFWEEFSKQMNNINNNRISE